MNFKEYVKLSSDIWNEFRNSNGVPADQQSKSILVSRIIAEVSKDRRMDRISEERRGNRGIQPNRPSEERWGNKGSQPNRPMTDKQHKFLDTYGIRHDDNWTVEQASEEIDKKIASWKGKK